MNERTNPEITFDVLLPGNGVDPILPNAVAVLWVGRMSEARARAAFDFWLSTRPDLTYGEIDGLDVVEYPACPDNPESGGWTAHIVRASEGLIANR